MACVTLWIIIQGILVMRGDMDARGGITRIIKVALVVGILTSSGLFTTYVQTLFITTIPNWFATAAGGSQAAIASTPATFDNMWQVTEHTVETVGKQIAIYDVVDAVSLVLIELVLMVLLIVTFAIYEFAIIVTGIIVAIGPVVIVGYLFEATKAVTHRWIGMLITYSLLTLLINVTLNVVLAGEKTLHAGHPDAAGDGAGGGAGRTQDSDRAGDVLRHGRVHHHLAAGDRRDDRRRPGCQPWCGGHERVHQPRLERCIEGGQHGHAKADVERRHPDAPPN